MCGVRVVPGWQRGRAGGEKDCEWKGDHRWRPGGQCFFFLMEVPNWSVMTNGLALVYVHFSRTPGCRVRLSPVSCLPPLTYIEVPSGRPARCSRPCLCTPTLDNIRHNNDTNNYKKRLIILLLRTCIQMSAQRPCGTPRYWHSRRHDTMTTGFTGLLMDDRDSGNTPSLQVAFVGCDSRHLKPSL